MPHPFSRTLEAASAAPGDVEDSVPLSPPAKQLLMSCGDVEDSVPISSTSEAAPDELCDVEDSVPFSTGEAAPTGSVPHSEPIVSTVRDVTGTGSGLLGGNPQSGCSDICSYSKRATVGVRATYATR